MYYEDTARRLREQIKANTLESILSKELAVVSLLGRFVTSVMEQAANFDWDDKDERLLLALTFALAERQG